MKKLSILSTVLLAAGLGASAQIPCIPATEDFQPQQVNITYAPGAKASMPQRVAPGKAAPASIAGKNFVTYYGSFTSQGSCAGSIMIEAAGDSVLLKGIASGYDLKGKYDPATGKLTIPTGKPVGTTSGGAVISVYNLLKSSGNKNYNSDPVIATVSNDSITFADGFYATDGQYAYVWMDNIKAVPANGMMHIDLLVYSTGAVSQSYAYPVIVTKTGATEVQLSGMAQWKYSHNYDVPLTLNKSTNIATLNSTTYIDYYKSGDEVRNYIMRYFKDSAVNQVSANPTFDVVNGTKSEIKGKWYYFWGYQTSTNNYSGWKMGNIKIEADLDFYNAPIANVDTVDGIIYRMNPSTGTATVLGASADCTDAAIKGKVTYNGKEYTVTEIAEKAFYSNKKITRTSIPATIKVLGKQAYQNSAITSLNIEDIGAWCDVSIPAATASPFYVIFSKAASSSWGKFTINGKEMDGTITIPEGVTAFKPFTFAYVRPVKKFVLPEGLTSLQDHCFYYCDSLQDIKLPSSLTEIVGSFYNCASLASIDIPGSVETIGKDAFDNCKKLTQVKLHTGTRVLAQWAFYGCSALTELTLPPTLDSIGSAAFTNCKAITSLTCRATTPPAVYNDNIFSPFVANCTLYVPEESIPAYKAADGWKNFTTVQINTAVQGIDNDADADQPAVYYNLQGVKVANPSAGIYIEKRGNRTRKVVITR